MVLLGLLGKPVCGVLRCLQYWHKDAARFEIPEKRSQRHDEQHSAKVLCQLLDTELGDRVVADEKGNRRESVSGGVKRSGV